MPFALIYKPTLCILSLYEYLLFVSFAELFGIKSQTKGFLRKPVSPEKNFFLNVTTIWRVSYEVHSHLTVVPIMLSEYPPLLPIHDPVQNHLSHFLILSL